MILRNGVVNTIEGEPFTDGDQKPMMLFKACGLALLNVDQNNPGVSADLKYERFKLSMKITLAEGEVVLEDGELTKIREAVGKAFPTHLMGAIWEELDAAKNDAVPAVAAAE